MKQPTPPTEVTLDGPAKSSLPCRLKNAIFLPKSMTAFETKYLRRMNRIALYFFYAHLPVFMIVAGLNGTGVLPVALMTLAVLAVPTLACRALHSERHKSMVFAFTAMCMGGVLVHAGQGPVQIEMHFYFFSILAMLALFANPMTVIVGAATVAVHHLALWYLAPASVFNYEAPLWVVLVHAAFVVLETFAASFIARNFFDNVIGLEKKVEERTAQLEERNREMQVVLDSVRQGIVTVDDQCRLQPEHSAAIVEFFGPYEPRETFADYLSRSCVALAEWFSMNWSAIDDGFLPTELALDQLPKKAKVGEKHFSFSYQAVIRDQTPGDDGTLESVMIVVSDMTSDVEKLESERKNQEILGVLENVLKDKGGFQSFFDETTRHLEEASGQPSDSTRRNIHTVKGNAALFGLQSVAQLCHEVEDRWAAGDPKAAEVGLMELRERWEDIANTVAQLVGTREIECLTVSPSDLDALLDLTLEAADHAEIARAVTALYLEPTDLPLERLRTQAMSLAEELERGEVDVQLESHGCRFHPEALGPFWSSMAHVIRNAMDHGLESPEERTLAAKSNSGSLTLRTREAAGRLVVEVEDDGRGVDWTTVAKKAALCELPHSTPEELLEALLSPNFSTRTETTELSGRGIGLSAAATATRELGGDVTVASSKGYGTTFTFSLPMDVVSKAPKTPLMAQSARQSHE